MFAHVRVGVCGCVHARAHACVCVGGSPCEQPVPEDLERPSERPNLEKGRLGMSVGVGMGVVVGMGVGGSMGMGSGMGLGMGMGMVFFFSF